MKYKLSFGFLLIFTGILAQEQDLVTVDGYVFESGNRGYLNEVKITITPKNDSDNSFSIHSDRDGFFTLGLPIDQTFIIKAEKQLFHPTSQDLSTHSANAVGKVFAKIQLNRKPGYLFDVTLAAEKDSNDIETEGISGALIEIYNNTTREEVLVLKDYPDPNFAYTFQKGNHYTLLIRKDGFFSKRLEAFVDVDGCILCFDGLASIENVTDNLTEGLSMGSLLANIELKRATIGSTFKVDNIFYDLDKANIRPDAAIELNKLALVLKDNPSILVELGSHTDSRGDDDYNADLSRRRAKAAVAYLLEQGLESHRIAAKGYGETELANGCVEGVNCTPAQHQENRRTEIKVVGLGRGSQMDEKSLVDIKYEENFKTILDEVQNQEVVEYKPGDEMPEDLRKMIEAQEKEQAVDTVEHGESLGSIHDETVKKNDESEASAEKNQSDVQSETKELEADFEEDDPVILPNELSASSPKQTAGDLPSESKTADTALKLVRDPNHKMELQDFEGKAKRDQAVADAIGLTPNRKKEGSQLSREEMSISKGGKATTIPRNFSGFMIEIKRLAKIISRDDELFGLFGDIYEESLESGEFSYLIAGFDDFNHCYLFFEQKIMDAYPNAKIIEFLSGKRL